MTNGTPVILFSTVELVAIESALTYYLENHPDNDVEQDPDAVAAFDKIWERVTA